MRMALSVQQFFRISGIPAGWTVVGALNSIDLTIIHDDQNPCLSLYPSCSRLTQTGLLKLDNGLKLSETIKSDKISLELSVEGEIAIVDIDGHFYDLTPLNTPGNEVLADVVAVTGLGGHAFGSWTSRETRKMWLKDFLPHDVSGIRIMSYGYNSSLIGETVDHDFLGFRRHFIQMLANSRRSIKNTRPIIFIGHSMGGILILQALLQSKQDERNRKVFDSTRAIFFFGAPPQDQYAESLLERIQESARDGPPSRKRVVKQLDESSNFLRTQREDVTRLFDSSSNLEIISFYETIPILTHERTLSGRPVSGGDQVYSVKRNSAQLFLPFEYRIPVQRNHSDMVQFHTAADQTYQTIVTHMARYVDNIAEKQKECEHVFTNELCECLKSLTECDYEFYRENYFRKRYGETCSWVFFDQRYRDWLENDDRPILWIHGGPGVGKSVLSAVLSKALTHDQNTSFDKEHSVAYFFCDTKDERLNTSYALLTNVLAQLLKQDPNALIHFSEEPVYKIRKENTVWTFDILWRVFSRIVKDERLKPMCQIIDALDECEAKSREEFLDKLQDLLHSCHPNPIRKRIKIVITSRPQIHIQSYFPDVVEIPLDPNNRKDVVDYVRASVSELENRNFPTKLRDQIQESLIEKSNGMFLWAYLMLYDLQTSTKSSPYAIRQKLKTLPESLPDLYSKILLEIKPGDLDVAKTILRWVVWAERPLTLQELAIAIAIQPEHKSMSAVLEKMELDLENILRKTLGALIKVRDDVVHLVHESAKEFLRETNSTINERFSLQSNESNLSITVSCLTYLSFDDIESVQTENDQIDLYDYIERHQFLEYSSDHWLDHMGKINDKSQGTPLSKTAFLDLGEPKQQLDQAFLNYCTSRDFLRGISDPFLIAAFLGFTVFVKFLLDQGADANAQTGIYSTALQVAAFRGNESTVRYLVEQGANVNAKGGPYGTALHGVASKGYEDIVRFLVESGADVNAQVGEYGDALQAAASQGHEDVVRYLVESGADFNAQGGKYGNAIQAASSKGNQFIVRYPVENGADVNAGGMYGTALQAATKERKQVFLRCPISRGAILDPDSH